MKKNSILFLLITLLLSVSMLVGCGEDNTADPTKAPATATPATETTAAPADPTTAPADPTTAPADPTTAPADPTTAPADPTTAPADPTTAPTQAPTQKPTAKPTEKPEEKITTVYLDQAKGKDSNKGTQDAPVATMEKAFEILEEGGTIKLVGRYIYGFEDADTSSNYVIMFPETDGKVTITSADTKKLSTISFEAGTKTTVQLVSPVEFNNLILEYDHDKYNGKTGNMNIYSGPELVFGEKVYVDCVNDACPSKPIHENCIAIRGGWHTPECKGSIYTGDDIIITVMSGTFAYINGGNADGNTPVGNSVITIGGDAEIYQRLQAAGSNGGDVTGNVTINITGGDVGSGGSETDGSILMQYGIVIIGHGKNGNVTEIGGDVTINITGGYVNSIHTTRTEFESLKGDLTINISEDANFGDMNITSTGIDLDQTQTLILPEDADASKFGDIWDEIKQ